jgi:hypothetical protein
MTQLNRGRLGSGPRTTRPFASASEDWGPASTARGGRRRGGYVLLETVIATGLLIVGLAVIGGQVQDAQMSVRKMDRKLRAMMLAEQQLGELEMGLIEIDSVDEVEEEDFGPRYPDYAWRLTTEETSLEQMFLLKLEILFKLREEEYQEDDFDFDNAEALFTIYRMQAVPEPVNFAADFGMTEDELLELSEKFSEIGIEGLDPEAFDLSFFQGVDFEELIESLPLIMDALGMDLSDFTSRLPPDLLQQLEESGVFGDESDSESESPDRAGEEGTGP